MPNEPNDVARKVRMRRFKRRLKASIALGVGLLAGAFLACTRDTKTVTIETPPVPPNPTTSPVSSIVLSQNGLRDAAVDRDEHRAGMPVPDNLLE